MHLCPLCFSPSSEQSNSLAFCLYFLSLWFNSIVLFPFALKHRHLSGQPSHLMALYLAFSLTYPDAVFTCPVPYPWGCVKTLTPLLWIWKALLLGASQYFQIANSSHCAISSRIGYLQSQIASAWLLHRICEIIRRNIATEFSNKFPVCSGNLRKAVTHIKTNQS